MKGLIAWRALVHEKGRTGLALAGMFIAIVLIFVQLGLYNAVPQGGVLLFNSMPFDLMLTSASYVSQGHSHTFPRSRLYQAMGLPDVVSAIPVYQDGASWLNPQGHLLRGVFVIGFDLTKPPFRHTGMNRQIDTLRLRDTILVDSQSRKMFGPLTPGRVVELQKRSETIGGTYVLGTGFLGLAVAAVSDVNFLRIFPHRHLSEVNLGLIQLRPGADPDRVAAQLRALLPRDTRVFTRRQLYEHEKRYWTIHTAVGPIFGFGVIVAIIVGMVILYQMLSTQISRYLSQYATLKALGYTSRDLIEIIVGMALLMWAVAFGPATVAALGIYHLAAKATLLPLFMTGERLIGVFVLSLGMSVASALLSIRRLIAANPAELF